MGAVTRNSLQYAKLHVNKYLGNARDIGARAYPLPFDHTHPSATVAGDIVNLVVIPAHHIVVGLDVSRVAMTTTAVIIGTSDDTDRFLETSNWSAAGSINGLPLAGMLYQPTADMIAFATFVTGDPTDATRFAGVFWVMPPA
jgi:hypothetical protein